MPLSHIDFVLHIATEASYCLRATNNLTFEQFINDETITRATIRSLEVIGEATKKLPPDFKSQFPLIPWKEMAGMRDRLIHNYFGIDYETVWQTLIHDIPVIKEWMDIIIEKEHPIN